MELSEYQSYNPFTVQASEKPNPGGWRYQYVSIFKDDEKIGSYERNYGHFGKETFAPFYQDGEWYALYSPNYTVTRILRLSDMQDIGGETIASNGFCPTEIWIPNGGFEYDDEDHSVSTGKYAEFNAPYGLAFVAGCMWGDDTSMKVECRDFRKASTGELRSFQPFGYWELPPGITKLADFINSDSFAFENYSIAKLERIDWPDPFEDATTSKTTFKELHKAVGDYIKAVDNAEDPLASLDDLRYIYNELR